MSGMPGFREPNAAFEKYAEESDTVHLTRQIVATLDHPLTIEIKGLTAVLLLLRYQAAGNSRVRRLLTACTFCGSE